MNTQVSKLLLVGIIGFSHLPAKAEESNFSSTITLTTDYLFRGVTQTDKGPAIQGSFDYSTDKFYVGTWASSVDFGNDTTLEIDFYGGYTPSWKDYSFDIGFIYYAYPDSPELPTGSQDFFEGYIGVDRSFNDLTVGAKVSYSPEFYGETGGAYYYQGGLSYAVSETLSMDAHYGSNQFKDDALNDDYSDYSVGVTSSNKWFDLDLRYWDTSSRNVSENGSVIVSISRSQ